MTILVEMYSQEVEVPVQSVLNGLTDISDCLDLAQKIFKTADREFTGVLVDELLKEYKRSATAKSWIDDAFEAAEYALVEKSWKSQTQKK